MSSDDAPFEVKSSEELPSSMKPGEFEPCDTVLVRLRDALGSSDIHVDTIHHVVEPVEGHCRK